ncbi:TPA: hypothetical protein WI034_000083 [Neisseria meningitidis]|uniref:hypothetical protein n=2 Tax=Neisseria meningitidis TaxID=487 RepID=UPI0002F1A58B|nr:hypothetical protein [Neisseria meningitidis]MBG8814431.1 hypothetical protein [Neisseria meningitidis]MBG8817271.1 hypothetical protein [Neisseria meningitidis]MBG8824137.1 hypothetical protein [Neisseria meningitidis]MBG8839076.1 hypothetical protein [Neisseria meningitidis]MBG8849156.1 hypothetical protein [Neisseria meningitidis]
MPSETLSDRFRRHSPIPPRRFSGRFLLNAKYPVIPTKVGIKDSGLEKPFYPISFRTDNSGFPPARE